MLKQWWKHEGGIRCLFGVIENTTERGSHTPADDFNNFGCRRELWCCFFMDVLTVWGEAPPNTTEPFWSCARLELMGPVEASGAGVCSGH